MITLALLGANGQVGAELSLMLSKRADLNLIPVCRNRSGSAFLRWQGLACRHGRAADSQDSKRLLADCDVIVNCSLASGTPAQIRRIEDNIVRNAFAHSKANAKIIHFSTQSVYGDPRPLRMTRWLNPYGRAKLATERSVRRAQRHSKKPAYILRLGHVCGTLQEISNTIRAQIIAGTVVLPSQDRSSNTVFTAAIVDAVIQIMRGNVEPGTYDLMNSPRWTWRKVYEYEAEQLGIALLPALADVRAGSAAATSLRPIKKLAGYLASNRWLRDAAAKLFAYIPEQLNARALAWWYQQRAKTEIGALVISPSIAEHLTWVENGRVFFPASLPTQDLLRIANGTSCVEPVPQVSWPADLPSAADEVGLAQ
jgi:nucleoside-diphosphate-sugar epimerase